jgi:heme exporter protein D
MDLGPHATFIIASYASAIVILTILIGWIVAENRVLKRTLGDLESRGIRRRSDESRSGSKSEGRKPVAHSLA